MPEHLQLKTHWEQIGQLGPIDSGTKGTHEHHV